MPANDMFSPSITRLDIEVHDLTVHGDPGFNYWFRQYREDGSCTTLATCRLTGLEVDFCSTLVAEAHSAWMYGEAGDVQKAVRSVKKQARAHARLHERGLFY